MTTTPLQGYTFRYAPAADRMARILELLAKPHTRQQLAAATHIGVRGVQSYLTKLMAEEPRRIYVHDWQRNSPGSPSAIYKLGNRRDKPKPAAVSGAERSRRRRRNPEEAIRQMKQQRLARHRPRRDKLVAAFFGAPL